MDHENINKKTPLPPPPSFDPNEYKVTVSVPTGKSSSNTINNNASNAATKTVGTDMSLLPKPPPPLPVTREPPNLNIKQKSLTKNEKKGEKSNNDSGEKLSKVHETKETIPTFESAPNSGNLYTTNTNTDTNINNSAPLNAASSSPSKSNIQAVTHNFGTVVTLPPPIEFTPMTSFISTQSSFSKPPPIQSQKQQPIPSQQQIQSQNNLNNQSTIPIVTTTSNTNTNTSVNPNAAAPRKMKKKIQTTNSILSQSQCTIPILVISTSHAQSIAKSKNNMTLSQMFTALSNSIVTHAPQCFRSSSSVSSNNANIMNSSSSISSHSSHNNNNSTSNSMHGANSISNTISSSSNYNSSGSFQIRSISKCINYHWENVKFTFYDGDEFNSITTKHFKKYARLNKNSGDEDIDQMLDLATDIWDEDEDVYNINNDAIQSSSDGSSSIGLGLENQIRDTLFQQNVGKNSSLQNNNRMMNNSKNKGWSDLDEDEMNIINYYRQEPFGNVGKNSAVSSSGHHDRQDGVQNVMHNERQSANDGFRLTSQPLTTPWLQRFRSVLDQITSYQPHDMLHCPPLILFVASTGDISDNNSNNYISALSELSTNIHHYPTVYQNGLLDPTDEGFRREYILLHDEVDGPKDFREHTAMQLMQNKFGPGCCSVIRLNSIAPATMDTNDEEDLLWDGFLPSMSIPSSKIVLDEYRQKLRGKCLSAEDLLSIRQVMARIITLGLIPAVERRIYTLNVAVTNAKKGVKNVLKSFWRKPSGVSNILSNSSHGGHSGRDDKGGASASTDVVYRYDSIESQTRLLADTLFLIRDYDAALSMYRLVKDDYKQDQSHSHYASVHEMIAMCLHFIDPYGNRNMSKEIFQVIETALFLYSQIADEENALVKDRGSRPSRVSVASRCVTRLSLLVSSIRSVCNGRDLEIADLLASASSNETPLGAAVLLEQSAAHYYKAGMYRKFAFHMLMAGHMFRSAGKEHHTIRCFTSAMYVYNDRPKKWNSLSNHLISALAGQLYGMKRIKLSLQLYTQLVGKTSGGKVSIRTQQKFLDHLIFLCRNHRAESIKSIREMRVAIERNCNDSLSKLDHVFDSTPTAQLDLEIHYMELPKIVDESIQVKVLELNANNSWTESMLGTSSKGSDTIWDEMTLHTNAEIRACHGQHQSPVQEEIQRVITEIDSEVTNASIMAKAKKMSKLNDISPELRAKLEPISVTFIISNPLTVTLPLSDMQLVAKVKNSTNQQIFTNEEAIYIPPNGSINTQQWRFSGSDDLFHLADFARVSYPQNSDNGDQSWISPLDHEEAEPSFVVTKENFLLDAGGKARVTLSICPMVMGELDIIGVRWKIFGDVWVYHRFSVIGPLLQNTPHNRANRVRGESSLLKSRIECDMPRLAAAIRPYQTNSSNSDVVLQGQITRWMLTLKNYGTAPASNITLKTNIAWINILDKQHETSNNIHGKDPYCDKTSYCIGPSGTLMKIPLDSDVLMPGGTVEIPVEVRTSGGGRQEFYMLFRYELQTNLQLPHNIKVRWLRKMFYVPVYPSLTITASLMPSYWKKDDHLLSLEMTNYRSDNRSNMEVALEHISVISSMYQIEALEGQLSDAINSLKEEFNHGLKIGWQEQVSLHYVIRPVSSIDSRCNISTSSTLGDKNQESETTTLFSPSTTKFICLEHAHDYFKNKLDEHRKELARLEAEQEREGQHPRSISQIRRANTSALAQSQHEDSNKDKNNPLNLDERNDKRQYFHPTSLESLCSTDKKSLDINVICTWSVDSGTESEIRGQHHLRKLVVRPQIKSKGCPLTIRAKHPSLIQHDFSKCPLAFDMELSIKNRLVETTLDFEFSVLPPDDAAFNFVGTENFLWTLVGGNEIVLPLQVIIFKTGRHNLQCVKLTVHEKDGNKKPFVFPLQWIVEVNQEDKLLM